MSSENNPRLYELFPFLKRMTPEERSDWYADMYEQYKVETPEEHEEYAK